MAVPLDFTLELLTGPPRDLRFTQEVQLTVFFDAQDQAEVADPHVPVARDLRTSAIE